MGLTEFDLLPSEDINNNIFSYEETGSHDSIKFADFDIFPLFQYFLQYH